MCCLLAWLVAACLVRPPTTPTAPWTTVRQELTVSTIAGSGKVGELGGGYADGPALQALFRRPAALAMDGAGNLYIADQKNQRIRALTPQGIVSTVAGSGPAGALGGYADGPADMARFADPIGLCVAADGSLYVADSDNQRIRRIALDGTVSTVAGSGAPVRAFGDYVDGPAGAAQFSRPYDVAIDGRGNLYVADFLNNAIRRVGADGQVSTLAGNGLPGYHDGAGRAAQLAYPNRLALADGSLYFSEGHGRDMWEMESGNRIRRIAPDGKVTTVAGSGAAGYADGRAAAAQFDAPMGVDLDAQGNLYVADYLGHCVRIIRGGQVETLAGTCGTPGYEDGPATTALFSHPMDVLVDDAQHLLYVADLGNHRIRTITLPE